MSKQEIRVPDLEGAVDVGVVEVYVSPGDTVEVETPLISLESDKAVMDVPSPVAGSISKISISEGDTVNTGDLIAVADTSEITAADGAGDTPGKSHETEIPSSSAPEHDTVSDADADSEPEKTAQTETPEKALPEKAGASYPAPAPAPSPAPVNAQKPGAAVHATPSVRSLARELGVDLSVIVPTGPKGRITRDDLTSGVKSAMSAKSGASGPVSSGLPPIPEVDFSSFGDVEVRDLSRIQKISGPHLHSNWLGIPHVTQFEEADITDLEAFRKEINTENARTGGPKTSPLIFIIRAAAHALRAFPGFNSSLNPDGGSITVKNYVNIGIAVDTPGGLVVPVIRDADSKGILTLAEELADLSARARDGKLKADEMKGATFTISSLGGIGGTYFTPIINAPEVAILGISRSAVKPVWNGSEFAPRLILPFSLSYDHRVIDGAMGARFAAHLAGLVGDLRRTML